MKNILKRIIKDFHSKPFPKLQKRELDVPLDLNKIISIIGPRRAGKTFYLFHLMMKLEELGVKRNQLLYINFEDERLEFEKRYDLIVESYLELYPDIDLNSCYFFFDEIQELDKWEKYIRRLYDTVTKKIFITGSNSKFLSSEIATSLRGRGLSFEIFPLSFKEYLMFNHIDFTDIYSTKNSSLIQRAYNEYLTWGGYPELINMEQRFKLNTLQEYFNVMIYRDLIERYEIKSIHLVKYVLKRLISSFTKEFSVNKIYNELKTKGMSVSKTNLYQLIEQIMSVYTITIIEKYDLSVVKREMSNRKLYLYDIGLTVVTPSSLSEDRGKVIENIVFIHLIKMNSHVFFIKNSWECDFIIINKGSQNVLAVQVTDILSYSNIQRELKGLKNAKKKFSNCKTLLLYNEIDPSLKIPEEYDYQQIWSWLLSTDK